MKKYKYVVVGGDSFSATDAGNLVNPGETYGDIVAKHYGAKCYNLAMSGGSFQRMGRKVYQWCAKNKDKFNDTLILLGMTSLDRYEIWNNNSSSWQPITGHYWDSAVTMDAHWEYVIPWTVSDKKKYFINFYNDKAQFLSYMNTIIGLQSFFKVNNIDHLFFDASANPPYDTYCEECCDVESFGEEYSNKLLWDSLIEIENWYKHPEYSSFALFTMDNIDMRQSKTDIHPNKKGHKYWSECLIEYINEKNKSI